MQKSVAKKDESKGNAVLDFEEDWLKQSIFEEEIEHLEKYLLFCEKVKHSEYKVKMDFKTIEMIIAKVKINYLKELQEKILKLCFSRVSSDEHAEKLFKIIKEIAGVK